MKTKKFYTVAEVANLYKKTQHARYNAWLAYTENNNEVTRNNYKNAIKKQDEVIALIDRFNSWDGELISDYINGMKQHMGKTKIYPFNEKEFNEQLLKIQYI